MDRKSTRLTARSRRAVDVLRAGGRYVSALRRDYLGREKQRYWIVDEKRRQVDGFGFVTWCQLDAAGLLQRDPVHYGSTCHSEWRLRPDAVVPA